LIDDLEYDDAESPAIGVAPAGVSWDAVRDHIKIQHGPLLVLDAGQYAGAWWTGTALAVEAGLGDDLDAAIDEFRQFLLDRGET
jgi:hypothetical protein